MRETTTGRNRKIFLSFQAGITVEQLAESYGRSPLTIAGIIRIERHKLEVSTEEYYLKLRERIGAPPRARAAHADQ